MPDLLELQTTFQQYLLDQKSFIETEVISTSKVPAKIRLDIYREAYYLRLLESLQIDYSGLHALIGDERFDELGRDYIQKFPSQFRSVRWFGQKLTTFIGEDETYINEPWLIEMAKFEWALIDAFDASDISTVTIDQMAKIPFENWEDMHYTFHPATQRIDFHWNIVPIWNELKHHEICLPTQKNDTIENWLIWRKQNEVQYCLLTVDQAYMLDAMAAGQSFGTLCEGLCEWVEEEQVAMHAAGLLKRFILDELIIDIKFSD